MSQHKTALQTILQENGYSVTKQRLLVFDLLTNQEPMTVYELAERAAGRLDRASIYRTVTVFERIGVVQRINIGWKYKIELSDKFAEHHHHLTCLQCGRVIPISGAELEGFVSRLATGHEFDVVEHQVELQGYCRRCRQKKGEKTPLSL